MEDSSSSEPPLCPCGFWGSAKTLGLCSKCYLEKTAESFDGPDIGGTQVACTQTKPGRSSKMDSNSKHCPSRSSADNLSKQPTCGEDQKDPATLPTSCATSSATEDLNPSSGSEAGSSRQSPASAYGMEERTASMSEGANVVGMKAKEDCVASPSSQTVDRPGGPSELSTASCGPPPCAVGETCVNERLTGADAPSPQVAGSNADKKCLDNQDDTSALATQSQPKAQGTKRSHDEMEKEDDSSPSPVKQKNKKRCFKCSCKLELAQREIGRCRCGRVFCSMHRLPELHGCEFDHKEDGRREAREKMVKPTRHLGTSFRRLDHQS